MAMAWHMGTNIYTSCMQNSSLVSVCSYFCSELKGGKERATAFGLACPAIGDTAHPEDAGAHPAWMDWANTLCTQW